MRLPQVTRIPLSQDWKPEDTARVIHDEVEKKWNQGWIFLRAETDALLESVCLYFDRPEREPQPPELP